MAKLSFRARVFIVFIVVAIILKFLFVALAKFPITLEAKLALLFSFSNLLVFVFYFSSAYLLLKDNPVG